MSKLERQMAADRELRDSARAVFRRELDHTRRNASPKAIAARLRGKMKGALDKSAEKAVDLAENHGRTAVIASLTVAGAVGLWLARKQILKGISTRLSRFRGNQTENGGNTSTEDANDE